MEWWSVLMTPTSDSALLNGTVSSFHYQRHVDAPYISFKMSACQFRVFRGSVHVNMCISNLTIVTVQEKIASLSPLCQPVEGQIGMFAKAHQVQASVSLVNIQTIHPYVRCHAHASTSGHIWPTGLWSQSQRPGQ